MLPRASASDPRNWTSYMSCPSTRAAAVAVSAIHESSSVVFDAVARNSASSRRANPARIGLIRCTLGRSRSSMELSH
jgi:hypothetical protein